MLGPAIVIAAGIYTAWLAVTTDDGLVADDYYKRGLAINRTLERVSRAAALGMKASVDVDERGRARVVLSASSIAAEATPVTVRLSILHPTRAGQDRLTELVLGPDGAYVGQMTPLPASRWLVIVETDAWRLPAVEITGAIRGVRLLGNGP
jgi:hypothetical protein